MSGPEDQVEPAADVDEPVERPGLSERDLAMLELERTWWKFPAAKESAIRERFGMSATVYYQALNVLIDRPEALAVDPLLVRRLQRMRVERRRQRSARRLGFEVGPVSRW